MELRRRSVIGIGLLLVLASVMPSSRALAGLWSKAVPRQGVALESLAVRGEEPPASVDSSLDALDTLGRSGPPAAAPALPIPGYRVVAVDGEVVSLEAPPLAGPPGPAPSGTVAAAAATPTGRGYWFAAADGGIFTSGDAPFLGSDPGRAPSRAVVAMPATPTGRGYWLVGQDGSVVAFGDAAHVGDLTHVPTAGPLVGAAATPSGRGLWVASLGGAVYPLGDAAQHGQALGAGPIVGIARVPGSNGYWLVNAAGAVFGFGGARVLGSLVTRSQGLPDATPLVAPVVGITPTPSGHGYWLLTADGGVFAFGDAVFDGSAASQLDHVAFGLLEPGTSSSAGALVQLGLVAPLGNRPLSLSFDDGPNPDATPQMLAIFARYHIAVTFFVVGRLAQAYPGIVRAEDAGGSAVENHTWSHPRLTALPPAALASQLDRTTGVLERLTHEVVRCVRPPYGLINGTVTDAMLGRGLVPVMWTVDTSDYLRPPPEVIAGRVVSQVAPHGIVLMHDGGGDRSHTVAALPMIIAALQGEGYTLVPVPACV